MQNRTCLLTLELLVTSKVTVFTYIDHVVYMVLKLITVKGLTVRVHGNRTTLWQAQPQSSPVIRFISPLKECVIDWLIVAEEPLHDGCCYLVLSLLSALTCSQANFV